MKKILKKIYRKTQSLFKRIRIFFKDIGNKLKYGPAAPVYMELIWVDPGEITTALGKSEVLEATGMHRNLASGVVVDWKSVAEPYPLEDEFRIRYCHMHWVEGKSWEELGVLDRKSTRLNSSHVAISYAVVCSRTRSTLCPYTTLFRSRNYNRTGEK